MRYGMDDYIVDLAVKNGLKDDSIYYRLETHDASIRVSPDWSNLYLQSTVGNKNQNIEHSLKDMLENPQKRQTTLFEDLLETAGLGQRKNHREFVTNVQFDKVIGHYKKLLERRVQSNAQASLEVALYRYMRTKYTPDIILPCLREAPRIRIEDKVLQSVLRIILTEVDFDKHNHYGYDIAPLLSQLVDRGMLDDEGASNIVVMWRLANRK